MVEPLRVLVVHGPNLNTLGTREPEVYGSLTIDDINDELSRVASGANAELEFFQSNHEGAIVDHIHRAADTDLDGIIINPGAYTHSSIAIRDALLSTGVPFIEVHISNVYARETFRHKSLLSDIADGVIVGLGTFGYTLALTAMIEKLRRR